MAGDDPVGAALGRSYDLSASKLVEAMVTTRNGVCGLGDGVRVSAHNYSLAEALSDVSGRGAPLPAPPLTTGLSAGQAPSSVGTTIGPPPGWGWVAPYIGMIWPTGNSGRLRAAAAAWTAAGTEFALAELEVTAAPIQVIRGQQMPEGPAIEAAVSDAFASTTAVVQQCQSVAAHLTNYADRVDAVHAAVLDLLARICDPMTGFKELWDVLTGEDEDEIRRIANDILTVIDHFAAEAAALRAQIAAVVPVAAMAASRVFGYAVKGWGLAFTGLGQRLEGIGEEAFGVVKGLAEISQPRALLDPVGYLKSLGQVESGLLPLIGAGGEHGPGVSEAWKQLGKGVAHWDEWKTDPFKALGKTELDLATLLLPGGPVSKLADRSRRIAESLRKPPSELLPEPKVGAPRTPPAERPPESKVPKSEAPAPAGKPEPAPAVAPPPHSPAESKPPVAAKAPSAASPKPAVAPPESAPHPSQPAAGQSVPAAIDEPAAPIPTSTPPPAAGPPLSARASAAPSVPVDGHPVESALARPAEAGPAEHHPLETAAPSESTAHPPGDTDPATSESPPDGDGSTAEPPADDPSGPHTTPADLPPYRLAQLELAQSPQQLVDDLLKRGCPRDIAETALNSPYKGMTQQEMLDSHWDHAKGTWKWPLENGFANGEWDVADAISTELKLDRIGEVSGQRGDFMGSVGDTYPQRALAPGTTGDYHVFQGTGRQLPNDWELRYGKVGVAFDQPGGGTQWVAVNIKTGQNILIDTLIEHGYLRRLH
ncbi:TNT domain-containing protein [Mycobacterium angelicum]|nr:TNT domain-containing protein [Mycobacterium angelicum]